MQQKKRKQWLDILRCLAIILVVFGHQVQWFGAYFAYTSPIKIPLFFAISGYLFNPRDLDTKRFIAAIFKKLVFPYLALAIISSVASIPITGIYTFEKNLQAIFSGESFWFMPCLIIAEIIFYIQHKISTNIRIIIVLSILCFIFGQWLYRLSIFNFAMVNIAFQVQLYLLMGKIFRKYEGRIINIPLYVALPCIILYIILCFIGFKLGLTSTFDPHLSQYACMPYVLFLIFLGNTILFGLCPRIAQWPSLLVFIGQNTLVVYLWAGWGVSLLSVICRLLKLHIMEYNLFYAILSLISALCFCCICAVILNRYFPTLVGKSKAHQ